MLLAEALETMIGDWLQRAPRRNMHMLYVQTLRPCVSGWTAAPCGSVAHGNSMGAFVQHARRWHSNMADLHCSTLCWALDSPSVRQYGVWSACGATLGVVQQQESCDHESACKRNL